ncbi:hypothetical protein F5Y19DRAFT_484602 [Xylariaceae sp. FL1651]|nr:hypothetical protein F5Y19DRAFT_484602 [Xylariaceae sp. FL1651]
MKTLSNDELASLAGEYPAPMGLYQHIKAYPFLGSLRCNTQTLITSHWLGILVEYTVGGSSLADGRVDQGHLQILLHWAFFQTSDPKQDNFISAEYIARELHPSSAIRLEGYEMPFQKVIVIDIVDGHMDPGDKILVCLGDRRWGSKGTRVQTYVEEQFLMRWYIDPVGTSRSGDDASFPIFAHTEDAWDNATTGFKGEIVRAQVTLFPAFGWAVNKMMASLPAEGDYVLSIRALDHDGQLVKETSVPVTACSSLPVPHPLFADLHVHSNDTVGMNSTSYDFFVRSAVQYHQPEHGVFGNISVGGDHSLVFLDNISSRKPEFPFDRKASILGAWLLDEAYATYAHSPEAFLLIPHLERLTGVLADRLDRGSVAQAPRARRTFTTTVERLVGLVLTKNGKLQGDDAVAGANETVTLNYHFYGVTGFVHNLQQDAVGALWLSEPVPEKGSILVTGATFSHVQPFGGVVDNPENVARQVSDTHVIFNTHTSGDFDAVDVFFVGSSMPKSISVTSLLGCHAKAGDILAGNPHKA